MDRNTIEWYLFKRMTIWTPYSTIEWYTSTKFWKILEFTGIFFSEKCFHEMDIFVHFYLCFWYFRLLIQGRNCIWFCKSLFELWVLDFLLISYIAIVWQTIWSICSFDLILRFEPFNFRDLSFKYMPHLYYSMRVSDKLS